MEQIWRRLITVAATALLLSLVCVGYVKADTSVSLTSPVHAAVSESYTVNFTYTPIAVNATLTNAVLYVGGVAVDETSEVSNSTGNYFFYTFTEAGAYNWSVVVTSEDGNFTPAYDFTVLVVDRGELSTYDVAALALLIVGASFALPVALFQQRKN